MSGVMVEHHPAQVTSRSSLQALGSWCGVLCFAARDGGHIYYIKLYMIQAFSHIHYSSLSLIRMPLNSHIILMCHVMIKNNGDFHFSSLSLPNSFFSTPAEKLHVCFFMFFCLFFFFFALFYSFYWELRGCWLDNDHDGHLISMFAISISPICFIFNS